MFWRWRRINTAAIPVTRATIGVGSDKSQAMAGVKSAAMSAASDE